MDPIDTLFKDLAEESFRANPLRGQNFTSSRALRRKLMDTADLMENDSVVEIGTGTGVMTYEIKARCRDFVSLEIDPRLAAIARRNLDDVADRLVEADGVRWLQNRFEDGSPTGRIKLVSSLPYSISTPVLDLAVRFADRFESVTLLTGEAFARKIAAIPADSGRIALSVLIQSAYSVSVSTSVPPSRFFPRPHIDSAILHLTSNPESIPGDWKGYCDFVRETFLQKRKTLLNNLRSRFDRTERDRLRESGIVSDRTRAGELTADAFKALFSIVASTSERT